MPEHHRRTQDHRGRVSLVGAHDVLGNVAATRLEESVLPADVATRHDTRAADQGSTDVGDDRTVQVRHDHNVELRWSRNELHGPRTTGQ